MPDNLGERVISSRQTSTDFRIIENSGNPSIHNLGKDREIPNNYEIFIIITKLWVVVVIIIITIIIIIIIIIIIVIIIILLLLLLLFFFIA